MEEWEYTQLTLASKPAQVRLPDGTPVRYYEQFPEKIAILNEYGSQGWELAFIDGIKYYFKRRHDVRNLS